MDFVRQSLPLLLSAGIGFFVVSLAMNKLQPPRSSLGMRLALGMGTGIGLTSLSSFLWQVALHRLYLGYMALEGVLLAALLGVWLWQNRSLPPPAPGPTRAQPTPWTLLAVTVLAVGTLAGVAAFFFGTIIFPSGSWDAWTIWNLGARFLYLGRDAWQNTFSPVVIHSDYPLLLAASVARAWRFVQNASALAPALIAFAFTFATLGLLVSAAACLRGWVTGVVAGLLMLCANTFFIVAPTQCADIPLAFFILSSMILLRFKDESPAPPAALAALAGMTAALATWTKNEGWLFLLAVLLTRYALLPVIRRTRPRFGELGAFLAGALPVLLVVLYFKIFLAPANDLTSGQGDQTFMRLIDPARYLQVLEFYARQSYQLTPKYSVPLLALPALALIFGVRRTDLRSTSFLASLGVGILMLTGYFFIYIISPHDLTWHLETALFRLFLHIWPLAAFETALLIRMDKLDSASPAGYNQ